MDDLVFFAEAGDDQVNCIKDSLKNFCRALGQRINLSKSLMFVSPNISEHEALRLGSSMGIPLTLDLGCYLGHYLVHWGKNINGYRILLQKVKDKLDGWKAKCLSRAGRITLAQSVLNNMANFFICS